MVPHKKIQLVFRNISTYFGTSHFCDQNANKIFIIFFPKSFSKFIFSNFFSSHCFHQYPPMLPAMFRSTFGYFFRVLWAEMVSTPKWQFFLGLMHFWPYVFRTDSLLRLFCLWRRPRHNTALEHGTASATTQLLWDDNSYGVIFGEGVFSVSNVIILELQRFPEFPDRHRHWRATFLRSAKSFPILPLQINECSFLEQFA